MKTTTRNLLTLASLMAAIFSSAAVIAQPGPGNGPGAAGAQSQGRAVERFQAADTDKDGALSKEEVAKGMPRMSERFAALDTNQDGKITSEEFQTMRNTAQGAGRPQTCGAQGMSQSSCQGGMGKQGRRGGRGGMQQTAATGRGGLINADTDKDGVVTRAEAEAYASSRMLTHFDVLDTDKDGKLSATELAQRQGKMRR